MNPPAQYGIQLRKPAFWVLLCGQRRPLAQNDDVRYGAKESMPDENRQILRLSTDLFFKCLDPANGN